MSEQIHPIQAMFDGISRQAAEDRAVIQMTLGELIEALEALAPDRAISVGGEADSYRGYYSDLAFEPGMSGTVGELLATCRDAMGKSFEGYKGGDYYMAANTPIWLSFYGVASGDRLMGLNIESDPVAPVIEKEVF